MNDVASSKAPAPLAHLQFKAALLLALFVLLVAGTVLYLMYARGAFESTQRLVLVADDSEGISVGMDTAISADLEVMRNTYETNVLGVAATFQRFVEPMRRRGATRKAARAPSTRRSKH